MLYKVAMVAHGSQKTFSDMTITPLLQAVTSPGQTFYYMFLTLFGLVGKMINIDLF